MPEEITAELKSRGADIEETDDIKYALSQSDIVYVTRVQRRDSRALKNTKCKGSYILNNDLLKYAKPGITIMHPCRALTKLPQSLTHTRARRTSVRQATVCI